MIDLHAHLLPGMDDGPSDWGQAVAMLRVAEEDGITVMAATSHQHPDGEYRHENGRLLDLTNELQERAQAAGLKIGLCAGAEVLASPDLVGRLEHSEALTYGDQGRYLLLEFPSNELPRYAHQVVFDLLVRGIVPVIAHPERNEGFARQPETLQELVQAGALAQMTAASLSTRTSPAIRESVALFLTHGLLHAMASDAHGPERRLPRLSHCVERLALVCGPDRAHQMVEVVPGRILRGEAPGVDAPQEFTRASRREAARVAKHWERACQRRVVRRWLFGRKHSS